ncbi:ATP-binding protein [Candidatus Bipolaricaulota bacterium]|nr:ATP-binding protein [Candidatus Bipolaricaulota bacterium]
MRQLVVLVGMPGSGKTSFHHKKSDWVVVSKDVIRQCMFGRSFEPEFEDAVDRIFAAALIETAESSAEVVCVDDLNLLRKERRSYVELGQLTERETVAVVMPYDPIDELFQLVQFQLEELKKSSPKMRVANFPRDRFDAMLRCYEAVQPEEGFSRIMREEKLPMVSGITKPKITIRRVRTKREEKQNPIPLFAA